MIAPYHNQNDFGNEPIVQRMNEKKNYDNFPSRNFQVIKNDVNTKNTKYKVTVIFIDYGTGNMSSNSRQGYFRFTSR